jgi:PPM family protein phosphatase
VLICSDGLSNKLSNGEIAAILALSQPLDTKGKQLINLANESGGEDNISFILMCFDETEV